MLFNFDLLRRVLINQKLFRRQIDVWIAKSAAYIIGCLKELNSAQVTNAHTLMDVNLTSQKKLQMKIDVL